MTETVKTYLRPIDRDGLLAFAEKGRNNPNARGTNKVFSKFDIIIKVLLREGLGGIV